MIYQRLRRKDFIPAVVVMAGVMLNGPAHAQVAGAELKTPYHLQIVLHVAPHRSLTSLFQDQLQRELRDQLRLALGPLAQVDVVRAHPLLGEIEARGLEKALDGWEQMSDRQTHFVLLSYAAGTYELDARRHDGATGQAGPLVRHAATSDRTDVATLAAQLVLHDFALVGSVRPAGKEARLTLQGGGLGGQLDRWVKPGAVFAVSRVGSAGAQRRATRILWALLEVVDAPRDGVCRCRYWHRYPVDELRELPNVVYRAVQLPTTRGPLRLRLLDDETHRPLDGVRLRVSRPGSAKGKEVATRDGLAVTSDAYDHLALVQVLSGDQVLADFPVALLDERPVVCRVKLRGTDLAPLEFRRDAWLRRIYDAVRLSTQQVDELKSLLKQSLQSARKSAELGVKLLDSELAELKLEHDELLRVVRSKQPPVTLDLREGEQRLDELRKRRQELHDFIGRVEIAMKDASEKAQKLQKLLERARLLEGEADFEQALRTYQEALQVSPEQPKLREHHDRLVKDWEIKSPAHAEARQFIYQSWPALDVASLKDNLEKARSALAACRSAGDHLSPRKLQRTIAVHAANLKKQQDALKQQDSEDNNNQIQALGQVATELRRLHSDAAEWLATRPE